MAVVLIQQKDARKFLDALGHARRSLPHGEALTRAPDIALDIAEALWTFAKGTGIEDHDEVLEEFYRARCKLFLAMDGNTVRGGFGVLNGELIGLFAWPGTWGVWLLHRAMGEGATRLNCFDGFLPGYYAKYGWREVRREPNYEAGGPDVIYMEYAQ